MEIFDTHTPVKINLFQVFQISTSKCYKPKLRKINIDFNN